MNIETTHYFAEPLGASWTVRRKSDHSIVCFRPDEETARAAMQMLEEKGTYQ